MGKYLEWREIRIGHRRPGRISAQPPGIVWSRARFVDRPRPAMNPFQIAVLPGDGIGAEVTSAGVEVLRAVESRLANASFELTEFSVGAGEYIRGGDALPAAVFERLKDFDAILLGAMGLPGIRRSDGTEIAPQLDLRERLELYCGLRPVFLFHAADSPLRNRTAASIDLLLVRESTEGLFFSRKEEVAAGAPYAEDKLRITRRGAGR